MEIKSVFFRDKQSVTEKGVEIITGEAIELAADASLEEKIIISKNIICICFILIFKLYLFI